MSAADSRYPVPARDPEQPLRISKVTPEDVLTLGGAAIGALGLTWLLYERVLPFTGALGFWLCWYAAFLLLYTASAGLQWTRLVVRDKAMAVVVGSGGIFACAVVAEQIGYSFVKGLPAISHWTFFTTTMAFAAPTSSLKVGGILHAAVGSLEQLGIATLFSVPLGITAALFLAEVGGRMERPVRTIVNAMTALPSIVAGLFIYAFAVLTLGLPESGLAASLAIAVVMLPTVTRASEVVIQVVPGTLREASFALGASHWRTVWNVILPTARSGLATAVVLAMARGIGETAPVLLTAGFTNELNVNPVHGWQATLPTFIITSVLDDGQFPNYVARAFGAGFALMLIVLILFTIARLLGGGTPGELTRRQRRRIRRADARSGTRAGAAAMSAGMLLLPWLAGTAQPGAGTAQPGAGTAQPGASPAPSAGIQPRVSSTQPVTGSGGATTKDPRGGRTIRGPRMWDPRTHRELARHSAVTVSQVTELTNQVVQVSWTGFTPSSDVLYDPDATDYPVMVAECKGVHPTRWGQCFGANNGGVAGSFSAYGPMNTSYATTSRNGTGVTDIQLLTAEEDQQLGCDTGKPCSLVVVPSQGGNVFESPPRCHDHSQDAGQSDIGAIAFSSQTGSCSWRDRIIIPMYFAPTPTDCPVANANFSMIGSPMLARAMSSWQSSLCTGSDPVSIQYDSAQSEPLARLDFMSGADDIALTTRPAYGKSQRPYTYAPVAITAESIAYWIDNPVTGKPLTRLKLNARLVAKLLTQSYNFDDEACGHGRIPSRGVGCDNAVDGDPISLFADPEFRRLNPHVAAVGDGYQVPTVVSGESDMTYELTRWMAASKAAKSFVDGAFDPWGEHVNTDYLNMALPTQSLTSMDPYPLVAHRYDPTFPLSAVAQYQADNWYPATSWQKDQTGNFPKLIPEVPGDRALFAILDQGDAAAYELPVAAIQNHAGDFVKPTAAAMAAAVGEMYTESNHITRDLPEKGKHADAAGAYPLTMVVYAMVPTAGISPKKAAKIAQFLDFAAGAGQDPGTGPGELPPGYLPLTAAMRAQTLAAARKVAAQGGNGGGKKTASASPSATPTVPATPSPSASQHEVSLGYAANPATSGIGRYALPVLLITGALLALAGSSVLAVGRGGAAAAAWLRRRRPAMPLRRGRKKP